MEESSNFINPDSIKKNAYLPTKLSEQSKINPAAARLERRKKAS